MWRRPVISGLGGSPATASARLAMFLARSPMRSRSPVILQRRHDVAQVVGHRLPAAIMEIPVPRSRARAWSIAVAARPLGELRVAAFERVEATGRESCSAWPPIWAIFLSRSANSSSYDLRYARSWVFPTRLLTAAALAIPHRRGRRSVSRGWLCSDPVEASRSGGAGAAAQCRAPSSVTATMKRAGAPPRGFRVSHGDLDGPPVLPYLMAFCTRFWNTCTSSSRSPGRWRAYPAA